MNEVTLPVLVGSFNLVVVNYRKGVVAANQALNEVIAYLSIP